ncbi:MAG: hypothetical protein ACTSUE_19320 [Promethearchaeota archaeon]
MNYFVLKGVILNANANISDNNSSNRLKKRVFNALAYPGFTRSTYDVIGVEFGLGMMEIDRARAPDNEQTIAKMQVWNLNRMKRFQFNYLNFLHGSRFALITCEAGDEEPGDELRRVIQECFNKTHNANVGIIVSLDDVQDLHFIKNLEDEHGVKFNIIENLQEFITSMISSCIRMESANFILPIHSLDEIKHVDNIYNPCSNHPTTGSENLKNYLLSAGYHVNRENQIEVQSGSHTFRLDLNDLSLHVALTTCKTCSSITCRNPYKSKRAFKRICIIWDSPLKKGYASVESGLTESDTFALSILYSIENRTLTPDITNQFPKYVEKCPKI